jgi:hypothetical protein
MTAGIFSLDPTHSIYEADYVRSNAAPSSGNFTMAPTPEPSALLLRATGLTGVGCTIRRRFRA